MQLPSHGSIQSYEFLQAVMPAVKKGDVDHLAQTVLAHWQPRDLCPLLADSNVEVRRIVAVTLGLVGDASVIECLTRSLRDDDFQVNQMAEHGLWNIWFRSGHPKAIPAFRQGLSLLADEAMDDAVQAFQAALRIDPTFSEAHNQCAIAHFLKNDWHASIDACRKCIALMPQHFGALEGMGHCYTQLNDLSQALRCYKTALQINPRLEEIADAVNSLQRREQMRVDARIQSRRAS